MRVEHEQRRGVGADTRERVMSQRELAGVAGEQIPADGENHVIETDHEDVRVIFRGGPRHPGESGVDEHAPAEAANAP